jgi:hypothetical protein
VFSGGAIQLCAAESCICGQFLYEDKKSFARLSIHSSEELRQILVLSVDQWFPENHANFLRDHLRLKSYLSDTSNSGSI